jgi:hypothetical protein
VFGSYRVAAPHEPPWSLRKDDDPRGREIDALHTLALRMRGQPRDEWPDLVLMIGDQVYADEVPPGTRSFIRDRRDVDEPPGERVLDFEEYHGSRQRAADRQGGAQDTTSARLENVLDQVLASPST